MFTPRIRGSRSGVPKLVFLITDGQSNVNASHTIPEAMADKDNGMRIVVVGVTNRTNSDEMRGIASSSLDVYYFNSFQDLNSMIDVLVGLSCPNPLGQSRSYLHHMTLLWSWVVNGHCLQRNYRLDSMSR